jgi:hypothetical protein
VWQARARLHRRAAAMVSCHLRNAALAIPLRQSFRGARQRDPGIDLIAGFRIASRRLSSGRPMAEPGSSASGMTN